jgi:transketolase
VDNQHKELDARAVSVIKGLILDATRKANSGHPGGAMSSADFVYILYKEFLDFDPDDPSFFNRDRFVLSAGHESMLLYAVLAMAGYLDLEDLKAFRQLGSRTPGHPERGMAPGVEATTGPLGQGIGMAGGMATAEVILRARLGQELVDHCTYVLVSDGDIQEPVALGSAALLGQWGLGKLIVYYDSNKIQLAGPTSRADCADYVKIFEGLCWQVIEIDGHDHDQIRHAIRKAKSDPFRPTMIIGHTTIAKGSATMEGSADTHGSPMSPEEIAATKQRIGLSPEETFAFPADVIDHFRSRHPELRRKADQWRRTIAERLASDPGLSALWATLNSPRNELSLTWPGFDPAKPVATRKAFGNCLNGLIEQLPTLVGGSADLDPSNQTVFFRETTGCFSQTNPLGRNLCFGVREFPMASICNGLALHGGVIPFCATFLVFSDYARNAIRMSALQKLPVLYVFTHDSFWVGEDGPTHQPIEHVSALRLIPNLLVLRPADAIETTHCMDIALRQTDRPTALILTRQSLPVLHEQTFPQVGEGTRRGGYVIKESKGGDPELILIASGSEVHLAMEAADLLPGLRVRVVSMPSMELFDSQDESYRKAVLPPSVPKAAVEAGRPDLWHKYVGPDGLIKGIDRFGDSGPGKALAHEYGFTAAQFAELLRNRFGG